MRLIRMHGRQQQLSLQLVSADAPSPGGQEDWLHGQLQDTLAHRVC